MLSQNEYAVLVEQELGNGWAEGVHPDDFDRCLEIYVTSFDARRIFEMVYRLRRKDGAWRWIFDRGVPFCGEGGEFAGYIGSCVDVTEKVEAEAELERSRQKQIAQLHALLPVCAWCRKIRTDDGYWRELESYLASMSLGRVTHSICQECTEKVEREFAERKEAERA